MNWQITSVGDGAFLVQILQGLAMLNNAGSLGALGRLGLILGVMWIALGAMLMPSRITPTYFLVGLISFMGFFGLKTSVVVTDIATGQTQIVANVPLGVAASGAGMSFIGYSLTSEFEQVFTTPAMTSVGFSAPLATLAAVRQTSYSQASLFGADAVGGDGTSFWQSWFNYIVDCTSTNMALNNLDNSWLLRQPQFEQALQYQSTTYSTTLKIAPGNASPPSSCTQAFTDLDAWSRNTFLPAYYTMVMGTVYAQQVGVPSQQQIADALAAMGSSATADDYVLTSLLAGIYRQAESFEQQQNQNYATQQGIETAILQNNAAWTSQSVFFAKYIQPFMAVTEGLAYGTAPFMALMIGFGTLGSGIILQYFKSILWIQLWQPMFALVNLFVSMTSNGQMSALENIGGVGLMSLGGILNSDSVVQSWLAVSGNLAATVPAMTAAMIWGGGSIMNSMISRQQAPGSERVDQGLLHQPEFQTQAKTRLGGDDGDRVAGGAAGSRIVAANSGLSVSAGGVVGTQVAHLQSVAQQKVQSFSETLARGVDHASSVGTSSNEVSGAGKPTGYQLSQSSTGTQGTSASQNTGFSGGSSRSAGETAMQSAGVGMDLGGGGTKGSEQEAKGPQRQSLLRRALKEVGVALPEMNFTAQDRGESKTQDDYSVKTSGQSDKSASNQRGMNYSETVKAAQALEGVSMSKLTSMGFSERDAQDIKRTATDVVTSNDSLTKQQSISQAISSDEQITPTNLRNRPHENAEALQSVMRSDGALSQAISRRADSLINSGVFQKGDREAAEYFAAWETAGNKNAFSKGVGGESMDNLRDVLTGGVMVGTSQALETGEHRLDKASGAAQFEKQDIRESAEQYLRPTATDLGKDLTQDARRTQGEVDTNISRTKDDIANANAAYGSRPESFANNGSNGMPALIDSNNDLKNKIKETVIHEGHDKALVGESIGQAAKMAGDMLGSDQLGISTSKK